MALNRHPELAGLVDVCLLQAAEDAARRVRRAHRSMLLTGGYAMKAVAAAFDVHYTTVSRAVRTYELKRGTK
jgi:transposase